MAIYNMYVFHMGNSTLYTTNLIYIRNKTKNPLLFETKSRLNFLNSNLLDICG